ncbi:GvpL/GvpF family gas vesicle protein [Mycobacterium sp.]|uniref:GvpL/GvpF family gas vesicle protein n=1 Tax=Mycobacterium sp. TaxID=1785 RepID=UPI002D2867BF|nr:GvpL/GvpF family gas vesicle protein [Mycobacterium sp.]HZA09834.1 GvpL/GvpF family gas vesicle protein [Mycobacterium sp.]
MTTSEDQVKNPAQGAQATTGIYVYGIVPVDVQVEEHAKGIGDPPAKVDMVREGDIAALISEVSVDRALGTPDDLQAHAQLLDGTASAAPVLPMRFGAVMSDAESVANELLREHHEEFAQALQQLEGRAEYIIKGRYDQNAILGEVLSENDQARQLREDIANKSEDASRNSRMALGELISNAIESKRQADTNIVIDAVGELASQVNPRPPTHEYDAVNVALLAEVGRQHDLEAALHQLAENWQGRVEVRLLGPLAPYDFVVTSQQQG